MNTQIPDRLPETWLYDDKSWERTLMHNYITYSQARKHIVQADNTFYSD